MDLSPFYEQPGTTMAQRTYPPLTGAKLTNHAP